VSMNIEEILKILPHRYPFVLIDRIVSIDPPKPGSWVGKKIQAIKNVTLNEHFFTGHFPNKPIMPGVLIIESMAQAAAVCAYRSELNDGEAQEVMIASIDNARFRRPVVPGDQLVLNVVVTKERNTIIAFHCEAFVDGQLVAEADLLAKSFPKKGSAS
jgi:3-hydroxyacyl-[acyl-carrier-protein] dehydratase